jgi:biotin operon repressor
MTELTFEEERIWEVIRLHRGKDNAVTGKQIAEWTGLEYDFIRSVISHLVNDHGYLIASNSRGYFIPETAEEIFEATRSLRRRGISILVRAARLQRTSLEEIFDQARMEFKE